MMLSVLVKILVVEASFHSLAGNADGVSAVRTTPPFQSSL